MTLQTDSPLTAAASGSTRNLPASVLVQASSRSWNGGPDHSVSRVDGVPTLVHTLRKIQAALPETPITIIAPAYDADGNLKALLDEAGLGGIPVVYSHDASPLLRMINATRDLPEDAFVMRVNGMNMFLDPRSLRDMLAALEQNPQLDCYKMQDNYPAVLCADFYRVGALRRVLDQLPQPDAFHVHIKHYMTREPGFTVQAHPPHVYYTPAELLAFKAKSGQIYEQEHIEVKSGSALAVGDQLQFHYELAMKHMQPGGVILDIGCGSGFGAIMLSKQATQVIAGDLDDVALDYAKAHYGGEPNVTFARMNAEATGLEDNAIDYITSFETIEHVDNLEAYLAEFNRILKPGGMVFISTPQNCMGKTPLNYWHNLEFGYEELRDLIATTFDIVEFIGIKQGRIYFEGDPIGNNSFVAARSRKA